MELLGILIALPFFLVFIGLGGAIGKDVKNSTKRGKR